MSVSNGVPFPLASQGSFNALGFLIEAVLAVKSWLLLHLRFSMKQNTKKILIALFRVSLARRLDRAQLVRGIIFNRCSSF